MESPYLKNNIGVFTNLFFRSYVINLSKNTCINRTLSLIRKSSPASCCSPGNSVDLNSYASHVHFEATRYGAFFESVVELYHHLCNSYLSLLVRFKTILLEHLYIKHGAPLNDICRESISSTICCVGDTTNNDNEIGFTVIVDYDYLKGCNHVAPIIKPCHT